MKIQYGIALTSVAMLASIGGAKQLDGARELAGARQSWFGVSRFAHCPSGLNPDSFTSMTRGDISLTEWSEDQGITTNLLMHGLEADTNYSLDIYENNFEEASQAQCSDLSADDQLFQLGDFESVWFGFAWHQPAASEVSADLSIDGINNKIAAVTDSAGAFLACCIIEVWDVPGSAEGGVACPDHYDDDEEEGAIDD